MIMVWLKKLNLIHDVGEKSYYKYIPLPCITYGHTGLHNMSFFLKKSTKSFLSWSTVVVQLKARRPYKCRIKANIRGWPQWHLRWLYNNTRPWSKTVNHFLGRWAHTLERVFVTNFSFKLIPASFGFCSDVYGTWKTISIHINKLFRFRQLKQYRR